MKTATKKRPTRLALPDEDAVRCPKCFAFTAARLPCWRCDLPRVPAPVPWHLLSNAQREWK